jgi:glutathione S-transferase
MLTFYFAPGSSSMAPHIALHEIGVPFAARHISFADDDQRTPEFRALNPAGKVPVLAIDGRVLTEVAGILFYLGRRFPEAGLLPADDIEAEAQIVSWMSFVASAIHPARRAGIEASRQAFAVAEQRLGAGEWAVGGAYTVADIHLFRLYWRFVTSVPAEAAAGFPRLDAHYRRMMARPAVQQTLTAEAALGYSLPR